jgi:hypothetical protein
MKKLLISAAIGASALLGGNAQAADLTSSEFYADEQPVVESVRMICDEFDRCWREPRRRTVIIERDDDNYAPRERYIARGSYNYVPRERYIERNGYNYVPRERYIERRYYPDRPPADVGIDAPGVSVGVGIGGDRW